MIRYIRKKGIRTGEIRTLIKEMHNKEIKIENYFERMKFCPIGATGIIQSYDRKIHNSELIGWQVNPYKFLNLGIVAESGKGKTVIIKNIVHWYHKMGYKVLVICPKDNEYESAKFKGKGERYHHEMYASTLPVSSYCPSYVKTYLENNDFSTSGYKFYSHEITNFNTQEVWESLGLSSTASQFAVGLINKGVRKINDLKNKFVNGSLVAQSKYPALDKINNMVGTKFINDRINPLDLENEWDYQNNVVVLNYFDQKGSLMSTDVYLTIQKIRKYLQKKLRQNQYQPVLVVFDDANYIASSDKHNIQSINVIKDCATNYRSLGMNLIVSYQSPHTVDPLIRFINSTYLICYIPNPETLGGLITSEDLWDLKAKPIDGGLYYDEHSHTFQWMYKKGRDIIRFFPFGCIVGHK